ncbi:MFS transporter [Streptomyces scabiei]|uniref:Multidrug resistance protein stp n=1 Tax=Streptomyces scabiei TaxID=1930 RepID=A0A100JTS7_STRSC|nr:MFS transporter [Streptomyces scabiei]GAQ65536.1 multidrug resistance protein stp [Streptomyces scabiei]
MVQIDSPKAAEGEGGRYTLAPGTLAAVVLAVCLAQIALSVPSLINGLIQQDLAPSSAQLTWITEAFMLPVAALGLGFGVFGDLFGRKRLLVGGAALIAVGSALAILVPGTGYSSDTRVTLLILAQVLGGIGAAAIFPTSLAMVAAGTHTTATRARGVAIWATALSVGGFLGPLLAGLAAKIDLGWAGNANWRWAFVGVLVIAVVSVVLSLVLAQNSASPEGRSVDWPGQITAALGLFALMYAVIQGSETGWGSPQIAIAFIAAAVFLVLFVFAESRAAAPLLLLSVFRNRAFAMNTVVTLIGMFAFLVIMYSTSIRLTIIQGFSPLQSSVAYLFFGGIGFVLLPLTSKLLQRYNPRWVLCAALTLIGACGLWFAVIPTTSRSIGAIVGPLVLAGVGSALAFASITAVAVNTLPNHLAGMASGVTSTFRDLGFALGPAIAGAVALGRASDEIARKLAGDPALSKAYEAFQASAAHAPAEQRPQLEAAVHAVQSGPLGANSVPADITLPDGKVVPFNPLKDVAFDALSSSYSIAYVLAGVAALVAAALILVGVRGGVDQAHLDDDPHTLAD